MALCRIVVEDSLIAPGNRVEKDRSMVRDNRTASDYPIGESRPIAGRSSANIHRKSKKAGSAHSHLVLAAIVGRLSRRPDKLRQRQEPACHTVRR